MNQKIKKGTIIYYKGDPKDIGIVLEVAGLYKIFGLAGLVHKTKSPLSLLEISLSFLKTKSTTNKIYAVYTFKSR